LVMSPRSREQRGTGDSSRIRVCLPVVKRVCVGCSIMIKLVYRGKEWELKAGMTARAAIKKVGLDPESVLVVRDGQLVTDDTILKDGDEVRLIAVISGGAENCFHFEGCPGR